MADDPSRPQAAAQPPATAAPAPSARRATFGPTPAAPADTGELAADYTKTPKNSFAEYLAQQEKDGKKSRLSATEKKLLNGLQTCPGISGGTMLFDGGGKPFAAILKNGAVAVADDHALDSAEHIDAVLKSALVAKSTMPQTYINGNDLHAALMVKCAEMAGLKVAGKLPDKTLKEMDPAFDARVEAEWKKIGGAVPAPADAPRPTHSAAADVSGISAPKSPLDKAPDAAAHFAAAVNPPQAQPTPAPAPAAPAQTARLPAPA